MISPATSNLSSSNHQGVRAGLDRLALKIATEVGGVRGGKDESDEGEQHGRSV